MTKQIYAITSGPGYEYEFHILIRGKAGVNFQELFDEFIDAFHAATPPFAVPEPEWDYHTDTERNEYERQYESWKDAKWDHNEAAIKSWNAWGYEGDGKKDLFISWLVKDKGFEVIDYTEQNLDYLHEKDESYYRVEPEDTHP